MCVGLRLKNVQCLHNRFHNSTILSQENNFSWTQPVGHKTYATFKKLLAGIGVECVAEYGNVF